MKHSFRKHLEKGKGGKAFLYFFRNLWGREKGTVFSVRELC